MEKKHTQQPFKRRKLTSTIEEHIHNINTMEVGACMIPSQWSILILKQNDVRLL